MRLTTCLAGLFAWSVGAALAQGQPADIEFFERKVRPLLVERCYSCHSTGAKKQRGGLHLDSRAALLQGGDSGPAIVPGDPEASRLVHAIRYGDASLHMPPKGKLADTEIAVLSEWVRRAAPFPGPNESKTAQGGIDLAQGRQFWSFRMPRPVPPPVTKDPAWARKPIDHFLLAALEKRGLAPSERASRRVLIRRVSFDLTGLPPTPEEIDAFERDAAPDAYARLVERLLASPHFGERWGRYWLDLTRYCDIGEEWMDVKGKAYFYRDWVVRALNEDMPYDRFVQMQLAADLMPEAAPADRAALGFLGLSPTYWKELKLDKDVIRTVVAEEWEERIAAISGTFLGLTVACARCHDHKFDPITMHDYYGLAGVLASTRLADRPIIPESAATVVQKARAEVDQLKVKLEKLKAQKSPQAEALQAQIEKVRQATPYFDTAMVPGVEEASLYVLADGPHKTKLEYRSGVAQDVAMQVRGNPANEGPKVPRRFLAVLSPEAPRAFTQGSGRLELAQALVREGASLSARVIVNRAWRHHFGRGLVETPSDFGSQGERPSHPELLDDLAARFMANGWSLKWLHREIVLSAAYQQTSSANPQATAVDPDNRLLWRAHRRRLDVEAWRDAMLAVTGVLDRRVGGPAEELAAPENHRRTLYGTVKRRELSDLLRLHYFPDPTTHSPNRVPTTTPLQQLFTLNSPLLQQQAAALVRRLKSEGSGSTEERVRRAYLLLFGRPATEAQVRLAGEFLTDDGAWEQYAQVLLGSNEFLFID